MKQNALAQPRMTVNQALSRCHRRGVSHTLLCALLLCFPAFGCGFLFSEGPPAGHEQMNYFSCTESKIGPSLDFLSAGLNIASVGIAISDKTIQNRDATIAWGAAWGAIMLASGLVGNEKADDCRQAKRQLADRLGGTTASGVTVSDERGEGWRTLAQWSGSGNQAGAFTTSGPRWRVTWTASNPGHGPFMYIAIEDETGRQVARGAVQRGAGNGLVYVDTAPGQYSIEVVAVNLDWDVRVEQQ